MPLPSISATRLFLPLFAATAFSTACSGAVGSPAGVSGFGADTESPAAASSSQGPSANAGTDTSADAESPARTGGPSASDGGMPTPPDPSYIPAHVRKLSNAEYQASVAALLDIRDELPGSTAADVRNGFYSTSILQRVDETRGDQLQARAEALAELAVRDHLGSVLPCAESEGAACARRFVQSFGARAFRRPIIDSETDALLAVFDSAATGGTFNAGVTAVITAVLQSASFLYIPALGEPAADPKLRTLTQYETASALSYLLLGAPPDDALLAAAKAGSLLDPAVRTQHVKRLLADDPRSHRQLRRFIADWLGMDQLDLVSPVAAPGVDYTALRPHLELELDGFVDEVLFRGDGSLGTLLTADFTMADATLVSHYGLAAPAGGDAFARHALGKERRGILTLGAFLSAHAGRDHSSPVKRGVSVLRRLLCREVPLPTGTLAAAAMQVPPATAATTTRERFTKHSTDLRCSGCHSQIDPLGFAFEHFDNTGRFRAQENGKSIDASGELLGIDMEGPFSDASELGAMLGQSDDVKRCFSRNYLRFAASTSAPALEDTFLAAWETLPAGERGNLLSVVGVYVASDLFITRSAP
jgi:hypothetical protein